MPRYLTRLPLAALCLATQAWAQNADQAPPSDSVLVTANRIAQPLDDIAAGVTVIDAATMQNQGDTTLVDALQAVPGLHVVQSGGPGSQASVFLRGADSDQVQVLIDGVPVNDPAGPGGAYNFGVDSLTDIDRIEVVRGPMSAVYGSGAIGGVINIITKQGTGAPQASVTIAGGIPASLLTQADLRGGGGGFDYALSAETRSDKGFDDTPQRETVYTGERDGFRGQTAAADLGYTPIAGTRAFIDLRGRASVYGYDDVDYPAFDDPNETGRDNDFFARTGVDSILLGGAWRTGIALGYNQEFRHYTNLLDADDPNQAAEHSRYVGERLDAQWNNTVLLPNAGLATGNTLLAGYDHSADTAEERLNTASFGFPYLASVNASDHQDAGYLGAQTTLLDRAVISGTVREQAVSGVGDATTWRLGASIALPALPARLKASYGTAFRAPSLYDRYGIDSFDYLGNPNLKPERSRGYELGLVITPARTLSVTATWFHTDARDLIQTVFAPVYTSINVSQAQLQGVELSVAAHPAPWIDAELAYTYTATDATDDPSGRQLLRRPYDTASATLTLRATPRFTLTPQLLYSGDDRDALVDDQGFPAGYGRNHGGATLNLSAAYRLSHLLSIFAWGKNLTDARYELASGYAQPGASFLAGIRAAY